MAFWVTNAASTAVQQRTNEILSGQNPAIGMPSRLLPELAAHVEALADAVETNDSLYKPLMNIAATAYTTTGNGFHLFQSRGHGL